MAWAFKILKHFDHTKGQSTVKIRDVCNSAYHWTYASANEALLHFYESKD